MLLLQLKNSPVQPSTAQFSPVQFSTAQYYPVQPNTVQYCLVQPSTAQYCPIQPSTAQNSPAESTIAQLQPRTALHSVKQCHVCYPIFIFRSRIVYLVLFVPLVNLFILNYSIFITVGLLVGGWQGRRNPFHCIELYYIDS